MATNFSYSKLNKDWSHFIIISSSFLRHVQLQLNEESMLTCDQAFFFSGERESVAARELAVGRREKKRTPDTITARVVCRPLFAYVMFSCVMLLM